MRLLLDTHALLWFALGSSKCSQTARDAIESNDSQVWVSPASHWEIAIKIALGKYSIPGNFEDFFRAATTSNGFHNLPIEPRHTAQLVGLPHHHRDPFDRLIIAQAISEGMQVVSADSQLDAYTIDRLW